MARARPAGDPVHDRSGADNALVDHPTEALAILDHALDQIGSLRSYLGAFEDKILGSLISAQTVHALRLGDALSTVRDADLAADAIGLAREQVLASVGASLVG